MATKFRIYPAGIEVTSIGSDNAPHTQTIAVAVTPDPDNNKLHQYNLPEASSLHPAVGLQKLYPGLKLVGNQEVDIQHPAEFIKQHRKEIQPGDELTVVSPGEEHRIFEALAKEGVLHTFTRLVFLAHEEPLYKNAQPARITLDWLREQGFEYTSSNMEDPDWPLWELARNPLQDKIDEQSKIIEQLKQKLEESTARSAKLAREAEQAKNEFEAEKETLKNALTDAHKTQQETTQELDEIRSRFQNKKKQMENLQATLEQQQADSAASNALESKVAELTGQNDALLQRNHLLQQDLVRAEAQLQLIKEFVLHD